MYAGMCERTPSESGVSHGVTVLRTTKRVCWRPRGGGAWSRGWDPKGAEKAL